MTKRPSFNGHLATVLLGALLLLPISAEAGDKAVASVNGVVITETMLNAAVSQKLPMTSFHGSIPQERLAQIRSEMLQKLIDNELLDQEAKRRGITVSKKEIDEQIALMRRNYPSSSAFARAMQKSGLDMKKLRREVAKSLRIARLEKLAVEDKVSVSEADMRAYYQNNTEKFIIPAQYRVRHILVRVHPGAGGKGWLAGLDKARALRSQIHTLEDFIRIARSSSGDTTSSEQGGDLGWFHEGQLLEELENVVKNMTPGDISAPIRTIYGFHIVRLEAKKPAKKLSYAEINKESLKKRLTKKFTRERREKLLQQLRSAAEIKIHLS